MTLYADELIGSEGERCVVVDVLTEEVYHPGEIVAVLDKGEKVEVKCDSGKVYVAPKELVRLTDDEDEANRKKAAR